MKKKYKKRWQGALSITVFLIVWHIASVTGLFGKMPLDYSLLLLPPPEKILATILNELSTGYLIQQLSISLLRVVIGFIISAIIGLSIGLAMALRPTVDNIFQPFVQIFSPVPGIAWVPLAILWFGLGNQAAIFIIIVGSIFPIIINTVQGAKDVDINLVNAAKTMGATHAQILKRVMLPSIIPYIVTGLRLGFGFAWRVVIAAEMVGVPNGLGYMLSEGRATGKTDVTIVTMVCLGVIMIIFEKILFEPLERRTRFWRNNVS
jgi:ABC-type nitrate/sulfonate/bicarbonate transport system permease component